MLAGKYRLDQLLGEGGMGSVWLGENTDIGRAVAIKFLHADLAADQEMMSRFRMEARAAAAIGHPGIVDVLDMGRDEAGAFIVMERLEGETLGDRLDRIGVLPLDEALQIVAQVADALAAAHEKGVIHRDLKPDNLFLVSRPVPAVKILDFGISKFRRGEDLGLTRTGVVMGTALYMSPEQARGARDINHSADIFSLGAILYHALVGSPPFDGESYNEVIAKVLTEHHVPLQQCLPNAPPALAALVDAMLDKDWMRRPQSARVVKETLDAIRAGGPVAPLPLVHALDTEDVPLDRTAPSQRAPIAVDSELEGTVRSPARAPDPQAQVSTVVRPGAEEPATTATRRSAVPVIVVIVAVLLLGGATAVLLRDGPTPPPAPLTENRPEPTPTPKLDPPVVPTSSDSASAEPVPAVGNETPETVEPAPKREEPKPVVKAARKRAASAPIAAEPKPEKEEKVAAPPPTPSGDNLLDTMIDVDFGRK